MSKGNPEDPLGAIKLLLIGTVVLSVIAGGLAVTAAFSDSSVSSGVDVQIDRQFTVPQFDNIDQTDIQTSSSGRRSVFRTQDGTSLRVIEEDVTNASLTVTVPVENKGTDRGTARISVNSSTKPFSIDTETLSKSFANSSSFARTTNHTVVSDTDALAELPPTTGTEPRAINVTLNYNATPSAPLTAAFELNPTDERVDIQPVNPPDDGSGGNSGGGSGNDGGGGTDPFSVAASTVVSDGLKIINPNGTDPNNLVLTGRSDVEAIGPAVDLDGDGRFEQPFVNSTGALRSVEAKNTSLGVQERNKTTLVPAGSPNSPRTSKTIIAAGRFNGNELSIFYASTSENIVRVDASGTVTTVSTTQTKSVSGIGDVDGDGVDELAFTDGSANLKYLEPGGSVKTFGTGAGSNNGIGVDGLLDVDGDGAQEQVFVDGSNIINVIDANDGGSATTLNGSESAAKSPVATADTDSDGRQEVLFIDSSSKQIKYIDDVGSTNVVRSVVNATGQPVTGFTETGLSSAVTVSGGSNGWNNGTDADVSPVEAQTVVFRQRGPKKLRSVGPNGSQTLKSGIEPKSIGPQAQLLGDQKPEVPFIGNNDGQLKTVNRSGSVQTLLNTSTNGGVDLNGDVRLSVADIDNDGDASILFSDDNGRIRRYEPENKELKTILADSNVDATSISGLADFDNDGARDELIFVDGNGALRVFDTDNETTQTVGTGIEVGIRVGSPVVDGGKVKIPAVNDNEEVVLVNRDGTTRTLTTVGQPTGSLATVDINDDSDDEILFVNNDKNNRIRTVELDGSTNRINNSSRNKADGNTGVA